MIQQTLSMFLCAYRELNAKKLFWVTMVLSGLLVVAIGAVGIDKQGLYLFGMQIATDVTTEVIPADELYKQIFLNLGLQWWLAFGATILALFSTAGMFPEMMSDGAIDLSLSRPISRLRLFITKYITGLLFVTLQIFVFTMMCFMLIGIRGGSWEPALFLSVPIVVLFFSYLFSVCVLIGVLTRSTLASLLLTFLFWFCIFGLNTADQVLSFYSNMTQVRVEFVSEEIKRLEQSVAEETDPEAKADLEWQLETARSQLTSDDSVNDKLSFAARTVYILKTAVPKTTETIAVLERWLIDYASLPSDEEEESAEVDEIERMYRQQEEASDRSDAAFRDRSLAWVIGTSVLFEAAMLFLAGWFFHRRDF